MKLKNLVISGAGTTGIGFLGILKYLDECNILTDISSFTGTSMGSILCFLITIDYSILELIEFCKYFKFFKLVSQGNLDNLLYNFGFENINKLYYVLKRLTEAKKFDSKITFKEHFEKTKLKLTVCGCCLSDSKTYYFNYDTYPDMEVLLAIKISCCIPLIFEPITFEDKLWIDGGITNNYPINFHDDNIDNTLGICIFDDCLNKCEIKPQNITDYIASVFKCIIYSDCYKNVYLYKNNTIKYNCDISCFSKFNINFNDINDMIENGYNCAIHNKEIIDKFNDSDTFVTSESLNKSESENIKQIADIDIEESSDENNLNETTNYEN